MPEPRVPSIPHPNKRLSPEEQRVMDELRRRTQAFHDRLREGPRRGQRGTPATGH